MCCRLNCWDRTCWKTKDRKLQTLKMFLFYEQKLESASSLHPAVALLFIPSDAGNGGLWLADWQLRPWKVCFQPNVCEDEVSWSMSCVENKQTDAWTHAGVEALISQSLTPLGSCQTLSLLRVILRNSEPIRSQKNKDLLILLCGLWGWRPFNLTPFKNRTFLGFLGDC